MNDGQPVPDRYFNRRYAINQWYRRTIQWEPVWFNSDVGSMDTPMQLNCWGRAESIDGTDVLTALALRPRHREKLNGKFLTEYQWTGRWALITQDQLSLTRSEKLAIIPFDEQTRISLPLQHKPVAVMKVSYRSSTPYTHWTWSKGVLTLIFEGKDASLDNTAGFIVSTRK